MLKSSPLSLICLDVSFWHESEVRHSVAHVGYWGETGHLLVLSFTGFDPLQTSTTLPMASSQVCPMGHIAKCSNPNCQNIPGRQLEDIRQLAADIRGGECRVWWA